MGISALVDQQKMPLPASQSKSHQSLFEVVWLQQTPRKYVKNEIETLFLDVLVGCLEKVKNIFSQKMVWWPSDCCLRKKITPPWKNLSRNRGWKETQMFEITTSQLLPSDLLIPQMEVTWPLKRSRIKLPKRSRTEEPGRFLIIHHHVSLVTRPSIKSNDFRLGGKYSRGVGIAGPISQR